MFTLLLNLLSFLSLATAHFSILYPEERGDPFAAGASEWIYPCRLHLPLSRSSSFSNNTTTDLNLGANVNQTAATNRTEWPLTGGSISLDLHHPWTYYFINLGLGTDYPIFNISLTPLPVNETGNGTLCLDEVKLPVGLIVTNGQNASIQVVTVGETGSALYVVCSLSPALSCYGRRGNGHG